MRNTKSQAIKKSRISISRCKLYLAVAAASQLLGVVDVYAGPEGGQVVGGSGSINQAGRNTTINQHTDRMAIDWQSFNVASDERVRVL
jgi:large exoprotein involved in heme utilization and adhesion